MMRRLLIMLLLLVANIVCVNNLAAQRIVSMRIDSVACTGDSIVFDVGYFSWRNVVVENPQRAISHPQCTFLPDGVVCDSALGTCTYRSPITFTAFDNGTVVTDVSDIDFVRLNMEHSYIGDLMVALECPNGQYASLFNSHSSIGVYCGEPKFDTLVGWDNTYGYVHMTTHLGVPVDGREADDLCDPNDSLNRPGVGWNYCWSENNSHQYAPYDGLIYRNGNTVPSSSFAYSVDSTHISADTHYYHPQQSFSALYGCPLSGTWNIVVQDRLRIDNGYLFDWELSFDERMYVPPHIDAVDVTGELVSYKNDSTFIVYSPGIDTVIQYSLRVVLSSGDTIDTVFSVHWMDDFVYSIVDTLCMGDTAWWTSLYFTTDTVHHIRLTASFGCDSIVDLSYTFMPTYSLHDTLPFCANEPFIYEGVDYGGPATFVYPHQTQYGCDSTVTVHLVTIDSNFHLQLQMSADGETWSSDTVLYGCRPMTVWLRDTTLFERWRTWSFGDGDTLRQEITRFREPEPITHIYDSVGSYTLLLTAESIHGCVDSAVFREDAVHVFPTPVAEFEWSPTLIVMHDPWTQFINYSRPMDSLTFRWHIPDGDGGIDTTSEVAPFYHWPMHIGDIDVSLSAILTRVIDDSVTLECVDSIVRTVNIVNDYLQFPNIVTPNGDGVNDRWEVKNLVESGVYTMNEVWIFNQWGVQVFHAENIHRHEDFWDPYDLPCPDGTYYFRFLGKSPYGVVRRNGVIEVMR